MSRTEMAFSNEVWLSASELGVGCAASLLITCNLAVAALAAEPPRVELRSRNFSVARDAGPKRMRDRASHPEQMRAVFGVLLSNAKLSLPLPPQVVAFRTIKEVRQAAPSGVAHPWCR